MIILRKTPHLIVVFILFISCFSDLNIHGHYSLQKVLPKIDIVYPLQENLIDATLACDGRLFPAHKFVLSMCSEYFKEMFTTNPCKHPIGKF